MSQENSNAVVLNSSQCLLQGLGVSRFACAQHDMWRQQYIVNKKNSTENSQCYFYIG